MAEKFQSILDSDPIRWDLQVTESRVDKLSDGSFKAVFRYRVGGRRYTEEAIAPVARDAIRAVGDNIAKKHPPTPSPVE